MTNLELLNIYNALLEVKSTPFPARISYILMRNKNRIEPIVLDYEAARSEALKKYSTLVPNYNDRYYAPNSDSPYWKEMEALNNMEADVGLIKFPLKEIENMELSLEVMNALLPMIEEETE